MDVLSQGRAAVFREPVGPKGVVVEWRERTPVAEGSVAIAVRTAALNHLDLWLVSGAQRISPPRVICADSAGVVAESGDGRWSAGDEVVVYPMASCGTCEHTDGTACELLHVPARNVYPEAGRSHVGRGDAAQFGLVRSSRQRPRR